MLKTAGYGGIVLGRDDHVVGNAFYQKQGDQLHLFSLWTHPTLRGIGLGYELTLDFIDHAREISGINRVRLGAGNSEPVRRIFDRIVANQGALQVTPREGFYVEF